MKKTFKDKLITPILKKTISTYKDDELLKLYKTSIESINSGVYLRLKLKDRQRFILIKDLIFAEINKRKLSINK